MNHARISSFCRKNIVKNEFGKPFRRWIHVGEKIHDFSVIDKRKIPELELEYIRLQHDATKADMIHLSRNDPNNVFSIGFHTPADNDKGIPHILEHTTLCGSNRYPVRDPFFKMLNRSLANFMNAFTASDFTFYPFATVNPTDYKNLRDVYLDATLFPKLRKLDFLQEGWRFEHSNVKDKSTPIIYNGVVFNEMKGQVSDSSYVFYMLFQQHLFQGTAYGSNSGGDPLAIPDLSYEELVNFHKTHYHPSNAKIFSYGSFPLKENLAALSDTFSHFSPKEIHKPEMYLADFEGERRVTEYGPADPVMPPDHQAKFSISFLANDTADIYETFALKILSRLCLDGFSSPMYQALIESGLGSEFSPNSGYDSTTKRGIFSVGIEGAGNDALPLLEEKIYSVFKDLAENGFKQEKLDAILHQMEISLKHKSAHFGMGLAQSVPFYWFNGVDPADYLSWNKQIEWLKNENKDGKLFQKLIQKYVFKNKSRFVFSMYPSADFSKNYQKKEAEKLQSHVSSLPQSKIREIEQVSADLLEKQSTLEDTSCLPTLSVSDINKATEKTELEFMELGNVPIQWYKLSPGLTYLRLLFPLKGFPEHLLPYLSVYCDACLSLGTSEESIAEIEQQIRRYTGGINVSPSLVTDPKDLSKAGLNLYVSGYCLDENVGKMTNLIKKVFYETNFDNHEKLATMLKTSISGITDGIAERGHAFARLSSASSLTKKAHMSEQLNGLSQVKLLSQLNRAKDLDLLVSHLKEIHEFLKKSHDVKVAVNAAPSQQIVVKESLKKLLPSPSMEPATQKQEGSESFGPSSTQVYHELPFQTNFASTSYIGVPYTHEDGAALQILSSLLTHKYLHGEIREKGGAYGAGLSYGGVDGILSFFTYRDADPSRSLAIFTEASEWAATHLFSESDLDEAKLSVFQGIDAPQSESQKGILQFLDGVSDDMLQYRRERLLAVTAEDVSRVAKEYLVNGKVSSSTILGPKMSVQPAGWEINSLSS
ncbi:metalloendopeptidase [Schizosaccharomyces cryophilus OY26]|uniref:Presequence protease, mitochondrial n=1 Tax=Schizosaccharomyces cryophilus (strain OY26 / ATCC MYA-4695 / CBS 11777 / NBRC 106824 / NRRL Y48691) TaxID=653667 RepID=S9WXP6_SCHCR|nr:metalloendopeptidase [Schizosaccharomyces cryophilus OY26]EPY49467.1 metalloendopeptidase [Schizosaccharomyces cryophilus OY26]